MAAAISFLLSDDASFITGAQPARRWGVADAMSSDAALTVDHLDGFGTVVVTSSDVTGRPVGKRVLRRRVPPDPARGDPAQLVRARLGRGPVAGARAGVHGPPHRLARRRLVPDLGTLRAAAWLDRTAICVADFVEMGSDELAPVAPRTILRRQIERVTAAGLSPQVASELEFAMTTAATTTGGANGYESLVPTTPRRRLRSRRATGTRVSRVSATGPGGSNLGPWTSQVEWGLGRWEVNLEYRGALHRNGRPAPAVQARDARSRPTRG